MMYNGFKTEEFKFQGQNAIVVFADESNRTNKWLLKTEYFDAFPEAEIMLLKEGYNLAHVDNQTRWCKPTDTERQADFCKFLHEKYGFAEKCVPVGMSCGGMQAIFLAAKHPELVAAVYLDAPVVNLLSCPFALGKATTDFIAQFEEHMGMNQAQMLSYREHPLDYIHKLDKHLPILLISGDSDTVVPYDENGKNLYDYAVARNMNITLHLKPGGDHHPHGLPGNNQVVVDFVKKHYEVRK